MSRRVMMMVGALIAGLMLPASAEAALGWTTTGLKLRTGPGVGYARIAVIPRGGQVEIVGYSGSWCRVEWAGRVGWVYCRYLADAAPYGGYAYAEPVPPAYFDVPIEPWSFSRDRDRRDVKRKPPKRSEHDKKHHRSYDKDHGSSDGDRPPRRYDDDTNRHSGNDRDRWSGGHEIRLPNGGG